MAATERNSVCVRWESLGNFLAHRFELTLQRRKSDPSCTVRADRLLELQAGGPQLQRAHRGGNALQGMRDPRGARGVARSSSAEFGGA